MPRCGVAVTVAAVEAARRLHGAGSERRPFSDVVTATTVGDGGGQSLRASRSRSVGALASRGLPPPPCPPPPPPPQTLHPTLGSLVADLQTTVQQLHGHHPSLQTLMDQLSAVVQLLKVSKIYLMLCRVYYCYYAAVNIEAKLGAYPLVNFSVCIL